MIRIFSKGESPSNLLLQMQSSARPDVRAADSPISFNPVPFKT
ncbi:hypothetical protein B425_1196 [Bacillus amyloliquefaciens]|nr:hypothetical protein LL3_01256 [Bacillus amyloliquefaciens LL3]KYC92859.1 hypothetical protein B425_1196 [Bacillus amyloliquefaciens]